MMNPSATDEILGDATVDFTIRYAKYNGYESLLIVNTSSVIKDSRTNIEDFVTDNYFYIQYGVDLAQTVVLGWSENGQKWGAPALKRHYSIKALLSTEIDKPKVFDYGNLNKIQFFLNTLIRNLIIYDFL